MEYKCPYCDFIKFNSINGICPNCGKFPNWRPIALAWWREFSDKERQKIVKDYLEKNKEELKNWNYSMIASSSSRIEEIYLNVVIKKEN